MVEYGYFDMIIDKRFIDSEEFYKLVIKQWFDKSDKKYESIVIYTDNIEKVKNSILNILPYISCFIKVGTIHDRDKNNINFDLEMEDNNLLVNIQSIDRIRLDQRGARAAGVIIDIDVENKKRINKYIENTDIEQKLLWFLIAPTNLNIGLVLYY